MESAFFPELKFKNQVHQNRRRRQVKLAGVLLSLILLGGFIVVFRNEINNILLGNASLAQRIASAKVAIYTEAQVAGADTTVPRDRVELLDVRAYILDQYFAANNSPLYGTGKIFVDACNNYGAPRDCVVTAAIARAETDLCKYFTSASYYNCWGYGGGGANRIIFSSWEQSIDRVTRTLVQNYGIESMNNPTLMEKVFCGSEPGCTGWGERVKYHMRQISEFPKSIGFSFSLFDLR